MIRDLFLGMLWSAVFFARLEARKARKCGCVGVHSDCAFTLPYVFALEQIGYAIRC